MCSTGASKCGVCNSEPPKYKCPGCLIRYCSLACFKSHKDESSEVNCEKRKAVSATAPSKVPEPVHRVPIEEEITTQDHVPIQVLRKLGDSSDLKEKLQNPHLRDIILNLDKSATPSDDIKRLMREPLFEEFVDECLKVVEPKEDSD